jgi:hypothetical protein
MHGSEKGFHYLKKFRGPFIWLKTLVKEVLTPTLVAVSD